MKPVLTFLLFLITIYSSGQDEPGAPVKQNGISISLGHSQFKDEDIHPKVFHGITLGASFLHSREGKNISEYNAGLKLSALNTSYEEFPSAVSIILDAGYRYLFVIPGSGRYSLFIGPVADMQYGTSAYFNWDESHLHFANYISGGFGSRISYATGNKVFDFDLDVPLVSLIFRPVYNPQYKIDDMTAGGIFKNLARNPEAALYGKHFFLRTGVEMKYQTARKKNRSLGYNFRYHFMQASDGMPYKNIDNHISYSFIF